MIIGGDGLWATGFGARVAGVFQRARVSFDKAGSPTSDAGSPGVKRVYPSVLTYSKSSGSRLIPFAAGAIQLANLPTS